MFCPNCGTKLPEDARFCPSCGTQLLQPCDNCKAWNAASAESCSTCGLKSNGSEHVDTPPTTSKPTAQPPPVETAELRRLTIIFCDIVGSTKLASSLSVEAYSEQIDAYQRMCEDIFSLMGGHIGQFQGDGAVIYFGYPHALENNARQAVRAGLKFLRVLSEREQEVLPGTGVKIDVRLAAHTGTVVAKNVAQGYPPAEGLTINLVKRMQEQAAPNTILVSHDLQRLVAEFFEFGQEILLNVKDFPESIATYEVARESRVETRLQRSALRGLTPLVGRRTDMDLLLDRWQSASEQMGQTIIISGEPGIGKSRLLHAFQEKVRSESCHWLECRCASDMTNTALHPILGLFRNQDPQSSDQSELSTRLAAIGGDSADLLFELDALLSNANTTGGSDKSDPAKTRQRIFDNVIKLLISLAQIKPVVFVVENIHWADNSTIELIGQLIRDVTYSSILVIATCRSDFTSPWSHSNDVSHLALHRLTRAQTQDMIRLLNEGQPLGDQQVDEIIRMTDGVPLFIEEYVTALKETTSETNKAKTFTRLTGQSSVSVPSSILDLLVARLDKLGEVKQIAQVGAVIGRSFTPDFLCQASGLSASLISDAIAKMIDVDLIRRDIKAGGDVYRFRHALFQEAAYGSLLGSQRQDYHRKVAQIFEGLPSAKLEGRLEVAAKHFAQGGVPDKAVHYYMRSAKQAVRRSANVEAVQHIDAALASNSKIGDKQIQLENEILLRETLSIPLEALKWGSKEVEDNLETLSHLLDEKGDRNGLFSVLHGLCGIHLIAGRISSARNTASEMIDRAAENNDLAHAVLSQHASGMCEHFAGYFDDAMRHFQSVIVQYDAAIDEELKKYYVANPDVIAHCMMSWSQLLGGQTTTSAVTIKEAIRLAEGQDHLFTRTYAYGIAACYYQTAGDAKAALHYASTAFQLSVDGEFPYWEAWSQILKGWALAATGNTDNGIDKLNEGLRKYRETGSRQIVPYALALLAEVHLLAGRFTDGLAIVRELEEHWESNEVRFYTVQTQRTIDSLKSAAVTSGAIQQMSSPPGPLEQPSQYSVNQD